MAQSPFRAFPSIAALFAMVLLLALPFRAHAESREELNADVQEAVQKLYRTSSAAQELAGKAAGMLVFPKVLKAGFFVGGEYGEGALLIHGRTVAYYNIAAASIGFQLGVQEKSVAILFMTPESLAKFRASEGWKAGVDGSVAIATLGTGKTIDTNTAQKPIIGFVYGNKGLMYNLTLEGAKITRIDK
ncbi:putative lipoprotein [Burkholderiales bacterium GJ-E10]|nr:putative lipoprotein [Burkholderiales bacterium GJ-E10]